MFFLQRPNVRRFKLLLLFGVVVLQSSMASAAIPVTSIADTIEKVAPAIVNISTTQKVIDNRRGLQGGFFDNPWDILREFMERGEIPEAPRKTTSLGSGFIIDSTGYIVTNYHVVEAADEINVTIQNNKSQIYKARVIGKDKRTDIALLKIDTKNPLPYLAFADSDVLRVGDIVFTVGNPFGLGGTVTAGIVSAMSRDISTNTMGDYIQTDAAINRGNSGGPLCNVKGEVVGVNSVILSPSGGSIGIGFAIPSSIAKPTVEQLKSKGSITRGWLGVKVQEVNDGISKSIGLSKVYGGIVTHVVESSPASKAGVKVGDVVTKFDGEEITTMSKLPRVVGKTQLGKKVEMEVFRDGQYKILQVVVEKPLVSDDDDEQTEMSEVKRNKNYLGLVVADITPDARRSYGIDPDIKGVLIVGLDHGSVAARVGLRTGDVIMSFNQKTLKKVSDFDAQITAASKSKKAEGDKIATLLLVSRRGMEMFVSIESED